MPIYHGAGRLIKKSGRSLQEGTAVHELEARPAASYHPKSGPAAEIHHGHPVSRRMTITLYCCKLKKFAFESDSTGPRTTRHCKFSPLKRDITDVMQTSLGFDPHSREVPQSTLIYMPGFN
jgi:hypothetical protein